METLKDIFVPYEIAQKLKEIGFNEPCLAHYDDGKLIEITYPLFSFNNEYKPIAPTYEQVFKWFRDKGIDCCIMDNFDKLYFFLIKDKHIEIYRSNWKEVSSKYFKTYEEAQNDAILKLIEIYEQNNKVPSVGQQE